MQDNQPLAAALWWSNPLVPVPTTSFDPDELHRVPEDQQLDVDTYDTVAGHDPDRLDAVDPEAGEVIDLEAL